MRGEIVPAPLCQGTAIEAGDCAGLDVFNTLPGPIEAKGTSTEEGDCAGLMRSTPCLFWHTLVAYSVGARAPTPQYVFVPEQDQWTVGHGGLWCRPYNTVATVGSSCR